MLGLYQKFRLHIISGVNGSVTLGDGLTQKEGILGDGSHPVGSRGEDPIRGLVDEPPKLILILEMDVKLIFDGGKIENAYEYNACCSLVDTR